MAWVPDNGEPLSGHRLITKAQIAIGDLVPMMEGAKPRVGKKRKGRKGRVASGRISKASKRS